MTPWSLALLPALGGAALFASGLRSRARLGVGAAAVLAVTLVLALMAEGGSRIPWGGPLVLTAAMTPVSSLVAVLVPLIALPVLVWAAAHEDRPGLRRLLALLLLFVGGMELLVIAADLLTVLIGWEIVGACSWGLIGHRWRAAETTASGLYAFVMTRFGDLGLFLAAMSLYAATGSFAFEALGALPPDLLALAAGGVLVSAAAKAGQVPFAPWLFRAMAGPTSVSALLHAATMVAAGVYLLARLHPWLAAAPGFAEAAVAVGVTTALAGGVVACLQTHAKKLLAASTSAHHGLMMVAVGAGYPGVAVLHLAAHAAFKALLFLAAGVAGKAAGTYALDRMSLGRVLPWSAACAAVGALALAGVPPLGAAWTKEHITAAAGQFSPWLAGAVMVAGGLSAAYAARFHLLAWRRGDDPPEGPRPSRLEQAALGVLALLTLALAALWLPGLPLPFAVPSGAPAETAGSLLLVGLGLLAGRLLARQGRIPSPAAAWLGLPSLIRRGVSEPFRRLAAHAARCDDAVIDAAPRAVARTAARLRALLATGDARAVDRGVAATAAFGAWLARLGDRVGETLADGLPEGTARLAWLSGADVRRLQSGLSHQYYTLLAAGAGVLILTLVLLS